MVYFHGGMTNKVYDENGEPANRLKLMHMAVKNPNDIHFGLSGEFDNVLDVYHVK